VLICRSGGAGDGTYAKDKLGNDIKLEEWLQTHGPNDRTLAQGLKGDPTYLVVEQDKTLASYGINAVCTHLGCVVPWNGAENKFICPCHGSQYNNQGKVVRGPAPLVSADPVYCLVRLADSASHNSIFLSRKISPATSQPASQQYFPLTRNQPASQPNKAYCCCLINY
jgi:nitrite reductase/ring-hydroxylating ferredoxin subunit